MIDLRQGDCLLEMKGMLNNSVDFILTDIPYNVVSRQSNGLRNLDKENADILTFDLKKFLDEVYRITKNSICIFCPFWLKYVLYCYKQKSPPSSRWGFAFKIYWAASAILFISFCIMQKLTMPSPTRPKTR